MNMKRMREKERRVNMCPPHDGWMDGWTDEIVLTEEKKIDFFYCITIHTGHPRFGEKKKEKQR